MDKQEIQTAILDALIQHQAYLQRLSSSSVNEIIAQLDKLSIDALNQLQIMLSDLSDAEMAALASARYTTPSLKEINSIMASWQQSISTQLPELFATSGIALAAYESAYIYQLAGKEAPAISGKTLYNRAIAKPFAKGQLFKTVFPTISQVLRNRSEQIIRDGISSGKTSQQIVSQIKGTKKLNYADGVLNQTRSQIDSAVRTARSAISSDVYFETWKALGFKYVMDLATLDFRTSKLCASLDHRVQKLDALTQRPPYHFRCRTVQIGCDKDGYMDTERPFVASDKPVSKIPKDQRDGIIGTVSGQTSYPEWFATQDADHQRNWLGESRYKLYKDGNYEITKFIDPLSNKLYTIADLKKMDTQTFVNLGLS